MALLNLSVEFASGVSHLDRRGVAFLKGHAELNAEVVFNASSNAAVGKRMRHKMTLWIQDPRERPGKFHGFTKYDSKYRACFTFIDIEEKIRYYGFRCNPKPEDPRYELIVLTSCVDKKEDAVDMGELDRVLMWKNHMSTLQALNKKFPKKEKK